MANVRPILLVANDRAMTEQELKAYRQLLAMLAPQHVQQQFREAYERCLMVDDRLPRARAIQELVTTWKVLWGWRRR